MSHQFAQIVGTVKRTVLKETANGTPIAVVQTDTTRVNDDGEVNHQVYESTFYDELAVEASALVAGAKILVEGELVEPKAFATAGGHAGARGRIQAYRLIPVADTAEDMAEAYVLGNVGAKPEIRFPQELNGTKVANYSIAVNKKWTDAEGKRQESTMWFSVAAYEGKANAAETLASGEQTAVKGTLWVNGYLDHEGDEKARYRITAKRVLYASGGASKTTAPAGTVAAPEPYPY